MFVLGLIIGIILGAGAYFAFGMWVVTKKWNLKSQDEMADMNDFLTSAGHNRKCVATLWQDDNLLNMVVFDEE